MGGRGPQTVLDGADQPISRARAAAATGKPSMAGWDGSWLFRIGDELGVADHEFDGVVGALRLSDGRIAVANQGTNELRWYSKDGVYLFSVGYQGEGPGEFELIRSLFWLPGDSVAVYDTRQARVSEFGPDGSLARTVRIDPNRFQDGGSRPRPIMPFPDGDYLLVDGDGGMDLTVMHRWVIGVNDRYELPIWGEDGALERIVRPSIEPLPVTSAARDSAMAAWEWTAYGFRR